MKLIDKEALLLALRKKRYSKQSLDLIESQPVVKAVPTEWMKKFEGYEQGMAIVNLKDIVKYWEKEK